MSKIKDFQGELLFILKELHDICQRNNIKYSLFGGTLIGAIRHKGFIPWDDDADVILERNEFNKLISVLPADFEICTRGWTPRFRNKKSKIFIDLFVLDGISHVIAFQKLHIFSLKLMQGVLKDAVTTNKGLLGTIFSLAAFPLGLIIGKKRGLMIYDKLATIYKGKETTYVFSSLDQYKYIGNVLRRDIFKFYTVVNFEDTQLMIIKDYDEYLTMFYGNYMKMPSKEKRVPEHGNVS